MTTPNHQAGGDGSIVPASIRLAAKRAFVRTTAQSYAATIPAGGVSYAALAGALEDPQPVLLALTVIAWLTTPLFAGAAAYADMISKGVPTDYLEAGPTT